MQKLLTFVFFFFFFFFFRKNISVYAIFNDQIFNDKLTNDIVSFERLGPDDLSAVSSCHDTQHIHLMRSTDLPLN